MRVAMFLCIWALTSFAQQQKRETVIYDEDIHVLTFANMHYPRLARIAHRQGTVVVRVEFDSSGRVTSANALSGWKMLVPDAVANSRQWTFAPNSEKGAIIIYKFRLLEGRCNSDETDLFTLIEPNIASVTACNYHWQP